MHLYEFVNPSDSVTFYAPEDKIAYACTILVGNGKATAKRMNGNIQVLLHTAVAFYTDPDAIMREHLGAEIEDFVNANKEPISQALKTFAYVKPERRKVYDDACAAFVNEKALRIYQQDHEDRNRTSFNKVVLYAWKIAEVLHNQKEEIAA